MSQKLFALIAVFAVASMPTITSASTLLLTPVYAQVYSSDFSTALGTPFMVPVGDYIQIDFRLDVFGLSAGENFWSMSFNLTNTTGLTPVVLAGNSPWMSPGTAAGNLPPLPGAPYASFPKPLPAQQSYNTYDSNGALPSGTTSHFAFGSNTDAGASTSDLQDIFVSVGSAEAANRKYGESVRPGSGFADQLGSPANTAGTLIGTVVYQVTSTSVQFVTINPENGLAWGTWLNNSAGAGTANPLPASSFNSGLTVSLLMNGLIPEPASFVLMGLAGLGFLVVACRLK